VAISRSQVKIPCLIRIALPFSRIVIQKRLAWKIKGEARSNAFNLIDHFQKSWSSSIPGRVWKKNRKGLHWTSGQRRLQTASSGSIEERSRISPKETPYRLVWKSGMKRTKAHNSRRFPKKSRIKKCPAENPLRYFTTANKEEQHGKQTLKIRCIEFIANKKRPILIGRLINIKIFLL